MEEMKKENAKLAAAGGAGAGDSSLEEMLAAKQAELQVHHSFRQRCSCVIAASMPNPLELELSRSTSFFGVLNMWVDFCRPVMMSKRCASWPPGCEGGAFK